MSDPCTCLQPGPESLIICEGPSAAGGVKEFGYALCRPVWGGANGELRRCPFEAPYVHEGPPDLPRLPGETCGGVQTFSRHWPPSFSSDHCAPAIRSSRSWMSAGVVGGSSTWWNGRATVQRNTLGCSAATFWTRKCFSPFTGTTWTSRIERRAALVERLVIFCWIVLPWSLWLSAQLCRRLALRLDLLILRWSALSLNLVFVAN